MRRSPNPCVISIGDVDRVIVPMVCHGFSISLETSHVAFSTPVSAGVDFVEYRHGCGIVDLDWQAIGVAGGFYSTAVYDRLPNDFQCDGSGGSDEAQVESALFRTRISVGFFDIV